MKNNGEKITLDEIASKIYHSKVVRGVAIGIGVSGLLYVSFKIIEITAKGYKDMMTQLHRKV